MNSGMVQRIDRLHSLAQALIIISCPFHHRIESPHMSSPHRKRFRRYFIATLIVIFLIVIVPVGFALNGLSDFDLSGRHVAELDFTHDQNRLSGSLILPDADHRGPIALIIHGDGPQNRFSDDGYLPLINALLDHGIGVYTWDKAGIGESSGNWLDQSMSDRAKEAINAFDAIATARPKQADKIGLFGFSQAGWVIPKALPMNIGIAFGVVIGGAANWQDQGAFYMRQRLMSDGIADNEITKQIAQSRLRDSAIFAPNADYQTYRSAINDSFPMSEDRFGFVKRNITADARSDLARIDQPVLALFGADDLNVDAKSDSVIYRDILIGRHPQNDVILIPDASHGLLHSNLFNYQLASEMPEERQWLFAAMGRYAYAPDVLDQTANWIHQATDSP